MSAQHIDKESLEIIRERLWARSKQKGITLEDIQDRTEFSYSQVYRIVRGKGNVSVSVFVEVCKALEVQPSEIMESIISIPNYPPTRRELKSKR